MIKRLKKWYARNFRVLTVEEAMELDLKWYRNIYGDAILLFNCRSIWIDENYNFYSVETIYNPTNDLSKL